MSDTVMNKAQWVEVLRAAGLDEDAMRRWHREFEARYPEAHQSLLEWLGISAEEITRIRAL
ncbi:hypothetical protein EUZ85_00160 [Hahella sp. KA22]|uniref:hypothetical protein n=1 Tax=Hahella sp. KA22 TaxID=1628392 RepID=UPI000FDD111A|nr:hypothetical protein [Hahella sp. KA22]AZZ94914.1 hypothetical protein ENC22_28455 [Hahella sp. KA22]QAY52558.1 hypothetical protein EUZ85_00160 [Hahella sp. KA22]